MRYVKDDKRKQILLKKAIEKMALGPHVAVGVFQNELSVDEFSMVDLAVVHEFGSNNGRIPPRSFVRSTCDARKNDHARLMARLQDKYISGQLPLNKALRRLGEIISKNMVQAINRGIKPKLAKATIKRKKSSKPLIDTGRLKGSITYEVRGA